MIKRCKECGRSLAIIGLGDREEVCGICAPLPREHKAVGGVAENPATIQEKKKTARKKVNKKRK
jgi:hypothetical protein